MSYSSARLSLERDGRDWPNRDASRIVDAGGLRWHVQIMGRGPCLLLLHGTGAATHSWRDLAPLLAPNFRVVAPDLPGHGFSDPMPSGRASLPGMASALGELLRTLSVEPEIVIGHSAGAAVAVKMCLDKRICPRVILAFNGALVPFGGSAGHVFPSLARLLFLNPFVPRFFAWSAERKRVARLLAGTGSAIDARGVELYTRLFNNLGHVEATLAMMANWNLDELQRHIGQLDTKLVLVVGAGDRAVLPESAWQLKARVAKASVVTIPRLGHLAHEEDPAQFAALVESVFRQSVAAT